MLTEPTLDLVRVAPCPTDYGALRQLISDHCAHQLIQSRQIQWAREIGELESLYEIAADDIWKHIALHLPRLPEAELSAETIPSRVLDLVCHRLEKRQKTLSQFHENSGAHVFKTGNWDLHSDPDYVKCSDGRQYSYYFDIVDVTTAEFIEGNLHYLQSINREAIHRYGLFLNDNRWPFVYLSINHSDRSYKIQALTKALEFVVPDSQCMNISRIFGPERLPRNSISALIRLASRKLSIQDFRYLITAVNPLLGFTAASTIASGFRPFALCPVAYCYDNHGRYVTRRNGGRFHARTETPPNLLFVRGICKGATKLVRAMNHVVRVPGELHAKVSSTKSAATQRALSLDEALDSFRQDLEQAWDEMTRYHRTSVGENDPISKGQCGVSSAYLATVLTRQGYDVKFCEGDVYFPDGTEPIKNHCWIKIPDFAHAGRESKDLIVDLTADQTGFSEAVVCEPDRALQNRGIKYETLREVEPSAAKKGHLSQRLDILSARLRNHSPAEE